MLEWLGRGDRASATWQITLRDGSVVRGFTLLMAASGYGHDKIVELLLAHGADVDMQTSIGGSALMSAASKGRLSIVQRLLLAGAQTELRTSDGKTAVDMAHRSSAGQQCVKAICDHKEMHRTMQVHLSRVPDALAHGAEQANGGGAEGEVAMLSGGRIVGVEAKAGGDRRLGTDVTAAAVGETEAELLPLWCRGVGAWMCCSVSSGGRRLASGDQAGSRPLPNGA